MKEYIYDSDQQKDDTSEKILFVFIFMPGKTGWELFPYFEGQYRAS